MFLFSNKNFQLHWASLTVAQIAGFLTMTALPWLVLHIANNDPVIMATTMALVSLPQGIFILFSGIFVDKFSPLRLLIISRAILLLCMASFTWLVYVETLTYWMLYLYAFVFGVLSGLSIPASQSLLPSFLAPNYLGRANGIVIGSIHFAQFIGPLLAGSLIWLGTQSQLLYVNPSSYRHFTLVFFANCFLLVLSIVCACAMRIPAVSACGKTPLLPMLYQGIKFCWNDQGIRVVLCYLILISFCLYGPLMASIPIFAKVNLGLSGKIFGVLYAMIGLGTVFGAGIAFFRHFTGQQLGFVVLGCDLISGVMLFALGYQENVGSVAAQLFLIGLCSGVIMVSGTTWFQLRTPSDYMGRVMSILMFCIVGMIPISSMISGYIIKFYSITELMRGTGITMLLIAGIGLSLPYIRNMGALPGHSIKTASD